MLVSYNWLQSYFDEKLPEPEKLAERITFGFAEIEGVEKKGDDTILDIKVLPDRACYALSHRGVAYEVAAITGLKMKNIEWPQPEVKKVRPFSVRVEAPELVLRYMARVVEKVTPKTQAWVTEHLEAVGQRAINPIVDGANIVMFDRGQPLHAFDADKVQGGIVVRRARKGEKITTLDNREVSLDESILVIADEEAPLAIAGIKGGKKAEVTASTKNLILESANFDASYIRKASERLGIKTDASKRFENKCSPVFVGKGMSDFTAYLFEMDKNIVVGEIIDWYPAPAVEKKIAITPEYISGKLGLTITLEDIEKILLKLLISVGKKGSTWTLTVPDFRGDLTIPEDIAEEVGRIIGYDKIPAVLPTRVKEEVEIPKSFYYEWKVREVLLDLGFSEIMTSSFSDAGDIAIEKPLAEDKKNARSNLRDSFEKALKMNALNAPLFGTDETRIFEIGRIFPKSGEVTSLAIGYIGPKKKGASGIKEMLAVLAEAGIEISGDEKNGVFEGVFSTRSDLVEKRDISIPTSRAKKFAPFSLYPFIVRDVALFVSPLTKGAAHSDVSGVVFPSAESVAKVIRENAGDMVVRGPELFDEFSKEGKKSLAFRLVFQSFDRTLSDEEVNQTMAQVYGALKAKGWETR